jgi:multidrug resistance efflux pump
MLSNQAKADLAAVVASRELEKSKVAVAGAALRSGEAQAKNSDTTLTRAAILAKDRFGTQAALDHAQAALVGVTFVVGWLDRAQTHLRA